MKKIGKIKTNNSQKISLMLEKLAREVKESKELKKQMLKRLDKLTEKLQFVSAQIITAISLNKQQLNEIEDRLTYLLKKPVLIKNIIDKSVLGGLKIIIGSKVIDYSLAGQLDLLQNQFSQTIDNHQQ